MSQDRQVSLQVGALTCHLETATDKMISEHNDVLGDRRPALYRRLFEESRKHEGGSR